jgi:hypothetical protein
MSSLFKECSATNSDANELGGESNVRDGRRLLPRESSCERLGGFYRAGGGLTKLPTSSGPQATNQLLIWLWLA